METLAGLLGGWFADERNLVMLRYEGKDRKMPF